jgi:hypothetical protein
VARLSDSVAPDLIELDDGTLGSGGNHLLTLNRLRAMAKGTPAEWVIVLEDDAVPVSRFRHYAEKMLDVAPAPLVSFYLGTGYPAQFQYRFQQAVKEDVRWIMHGWMRHAVAYAVSLDLVPSLTEHMTTLIRDRWAADDAISAYAIQQGLPVAYTNPSLVDHEDGPPVIGQRTHLGRPITGRKRPRRAMNYGTPLTIDDKAATV